MTQIVLDQAQNTHVQLNCKLLSFEQESVLFILNCILCTMRANPGKVEDLCWVNEGRITIRIYNKYYMYYSVHIIWTEQRGGRSCWVYEGRITKRIYNMYLLYVLYCTSWTDLCWVYERRITKRNYYAVCTVQCGLIFREVEDLCWVYEGQITKTSSGSGIQMTSRTKDTFNSINLSA